jgi:hypothetical protein
MTPREILNTLGRERVAAALGVTVLRVDRATNERRLPASWYDVLCELAGYDLPRTIFTFKRNIDGY